MQKQVSFRKDLSIKIAKDFEHGKTVKKIIEDYADEYEHLFRTKINPCHIQRIISLYCSQDFLDGYNENLVNRIIEYRKQGMIFRDIAELVECSVCKVNQLYNSNKSQSRQNKLGQEGISKQEIQKLKDTINNGDKVKMLVKKYYVDSDCREHVKIVREEVEIKSKYPNFAETSQGCLTWGQIAMFIREERKAQ